MDKWELYKVKDETKQAIKAKAKAYGVSIADLLTIMINNETEQSESQLTQVNNRPTSYKAWTIASVSQDVIDKIKDKAKTRKQSISKALSYLLAVEVAYKKILKDKADIKDDIKAKTIAFWQDI